MELHTSKRESILVDSSLHSLMHDQVYLDIREIDRRVSHSEMGRFSTLLPSRTGLRPLLHRLLQAKTTTVILVIFTVFSLIGDDLRMLAFTKFADPATDVCLLLVIGGFSLEITLTLWLQADYRCSLFCTLDILSTISLIMDVSWFSESGFGQGIQSGVMPAQTAFRASRAGSRTTRIIRFLRLFRILRLVRLYRATHAAVQNKSNQVQDDLPIPTESRIGRKLSGLTTKRVITIILVLMILLPLCDVSIYLDLSITSGVYGTDFIQKSIGSMSWLQVVYQFIDYHQDDRRPLIFLSIESLQSSFIWSTHVDPDDLRLTEKYISVSGDIVAVFDLRADTQLEAALSLCRTFFICAAFTIGVFYLTKDANDMVIVPIEKMMHKVKRISENPLLPLDEELNDVYDMDTAQHCCHIDTQHQKETAVLENSILKISALLGLSFGEAGAAIISSNFEKTGKVNLMMEGNKIQAIFGLCDVRNFTDTTEVLQEDILMFINEIAGIVHYTVTAHLGAPNKNVGDAFLFVWKTPEDSPLSYLTNLADLSIISCLKIVAYLCSSPKILKYHTHHQLMRRMPNYSVKLGFGLHYGWAIEGPMGSDLKIDVSYLSPHVIITEKLQELTKKYGVSVVFSSYLFEILSSPVQIRSRHIDTVLFRACEAPMRIYAFDVETNFLVSQTHHIFCKETAKKKKQLLMQEMKVPGFHVFLKFSLSRKLLMVKANLEEDFYQLFRMAVLAYEKGEWDTSRFLLERARNEGGEDQPTEALYKLLQEHDFHCPADWKGYREIPDC